jgi:hypothetical protein
MEGFVVTQSGAQNFVAAGGTTSAITATLVPTPATLYDGMVVNLKMPLTAIDGTASLPSLNLVTTALTGAKWACKPGGGYIRAQDWKAGDIVSWAWNQTGNRWELRDQRAGVKVSSNDARPGYLNGKLVAGAGITLTEGSNAGDEILTINSSSGRTFIGSYAVPTTSLPTTITMSNVMSSAYQYYDIEWEEVHQNLNSSLPSNAWLKVAFSKDNATWSTAEVISVCGSNYYSSGTLKFYGNGQLNIGFLSMPGFLNLPYAGGVFGLQSVAPGSAATYVSLRLTCSAGFRQYSKVSIYGYN